MIASLWVDRGSRSLDDTLAELDDALTVTNEERQRQAQADALALMAGAGIEVD